MKLLFDENLSHRLVERLAAEFPQSAHVRGIGMGSAPDRSVARYAAANGMVLVTKDGDFEDLALLLDGPPRILRLDIGNCTTEEIEATLRRATKELPALFAASRVVVLGRR